MKLRLALWRKSEKSNDYANGVEMSTIPKTNTPVYVMQEQWEAVKGQLKSFAEVCQLFEATK